MAESAGGRLAGRTALITGAPVASARRWPDGWRPRALRLCSDTSRFRLVEVCDRPIVLMLVVLNDQAVIRPGAVKRQPDPSTGSVRISQHLVAQVQHVHLIASTSVHRGLPSSRVACTRSRTRGRWTPTEVTGRPTTPCGPSRTTAWFTTSEPAASPKSDANKATAERTPRGSSRATSPAKPSRSSEPPCASSSPSLGSLD